MFLKHFYFLVIYLLCSFIHAQTGGMPVGNVSPGGMKAMKPSSIGRVYGKVLDAQSKNPVEYAAVALYWFNKDSLIAGGLVKTNGDFSLDNLPAVGQLKLKISFIGYKTYETRVSIIAPQKLEQDLGDILLQPDEELLKGVEITAEKSTFEMSIDRKVYNVDKDLSAKGGTGIDVMKNIPSVTVDGDGNVQLRNSSPQIFIDGKQTTLTLQQIPADQIERVEVITNPSVKYDANTTGGIINVILKRNTKPGYNGMVMGTVGTGNRYGGLVNLNVKENPFNISLTYNYNTSTNNNAGYTHRTSLSNGSVIGYFNQTNLAVMTNQFQTGRLAIDYYVNNRNTLTFSENIMGGRFATVDKQEYDIGDSLKQTILTGDRINDQGSHFYNLTSQLQYRRTYPKVGKELTADINHSYSEGENGYLFTTNSYTTNGSALPFNPTIQKNAGNSRANQYIAQLDFTNPLSETSKLEVGLKSFYKTSISNNNASNYSYVSSDYEKDSVLTNNYVIDELINAAYINYSGTKWNINYQAGLRFEQSYYSGKIVDKNQKFSYSYPIDGATIFKSIFPGIYLSKKLANNQEVQFNVTRKIDRPNFFQMMPFVMFADKQNYRIGNPQLRPEFRTIVEVNYNKIASKLNWLSSLYGRYEEQPVTNVAYPLANDPSVLINTWTNGKNGFRYGFENTLKVSPIKAIDITWSANVFYVYVQGTVIQNQPEVKAEGYSYMTKMNVSWRLPKQVTFQVNGNYEAPKVILQGKTVPQYFMDVSLNKMIGMKWIFNLSLSDAFNTKRMGTNYDTPYYVQNISRRREMRYLKFSVTYVFGKAEASIFKKRGKRDGGSNMGGQDGMDF